MIEVLRDPAWQFVGAILALLSIAAAFGVHWLQRQTKELAFGLVSSRRLLAVADEVSSRVTVQLDGKTVKNLHLLVYGLRNSGHRAIAPTDFERALSISFQDGQVVSAQISSQLPPNLSANLTISESRIELQPLLLNPGDQVLLQVLLSAAKPSASVDTRILDVPSLVPINVRPRAPPFHQSGLLPLTVVFLAGALLAYLVARSDRMYLVFLAIATFVLVAGYGARLVEGYGTSARRRIGEA